MVDAEERLQLLVARLRQENERYRAALEEMRPIVEGMVQTDAHENAMRLLDILYDVFARTALKEEKDDERKL